MYTTRCCRRRSAGARTARKYLFLLFPSHLLASPPSESQPAELALQLRSPAFFSCQEPSFGGRSAPVPNPQPPRSKPTRTEPTRLDDCQRSHPWPIMRRHHLASSAVHPGRRLSTSVSGPLSPANPGMIVQCRTPSIDNCWVQCIPSSQPGPIPPCRTQATAHDGEGKEFPKRERAPQQGGRI